MEALLNALPNRDLFSLLAALVRFLDAAAQTVRLPASLFYIAGICFALCVGLLGYKWSKLWTAILGACTVYYLTGNGIVLLDRSVEWSIPPVLVYALAIVAGVALFLLTFKCFAFVFYTVMGTVGFFVAMFYTDNSLLSLVAALFLALVCVLALRVAVIGITSAAAAGLLVGMLSALFPSVAVLAPRAGNWWMLAIIAAVAVLFAVLQLLTTKKAKRPDPKKGERETYADEYL